MASKREQVLEAVKAVWVAALPNATVQRNPGKPEEASPGGDVHIGDGDPGEPEVDLSPLTHNYSHRIPCLIAPPEAVADPQAWLDENMGLFGLAVRADRFLGGLCQFLSVEAPTVDDLEIYGAAASRFALVMVVAEYATPDPLN